MVKSQGYAAILPLAVFLIVFFYVPFAVLAARSLQLPGGGVGLDNYLAIFRDPTYARVLAFSLAVAAANTLATLALAYPAALYIAFYAPRREAAILTVLIISPFWVDLLLRAIALKTLLQALGVREGLTAMLLGMVYDYLPIMFLPIYAGLAKVSRSIVEAAKTLGAGELQVLRRVVLPLSLPGVAAGVILVFLMSVTEFVIPSLLGGTRGFTVGSLIYHTFLSGGMWGVGAALTVLVTFALAVAAVVASRRVEVFR